MIARHVGSLLRCTGKEPGITHVCVSATSVEPLWSAIHGRVIRRIVIQFNCRQHSCAKEYKYLPFLCDSPLNHTIFSQMHPNGKITLTRFSVFAEYQNCSRSYYVCSLLFSTTKPGVFRLQGSERPDSARILCSCLEKMEVGMFKTCALCKYRRILLPTMTLQQVWNTISWINAACGCAIYLCVRCMAVYKGRLAQCRLRFLASLALSVEMQVIDWHVFSLC
jgi:hypothetical protein